MKKLSWLIVSFTFIYLFYSFTFQHMYGIGYIMCVWGGGRGRCVLLSLCNLKHVYIFVLKVLSTIIVNIYIIKAREYFYSGIFLPLHERWIMSTCKNIRCTCKINMLACKLQIFLKNSIIIWVEWLTNAVIWHHVCTMLHNHSNLRFFMLTYDLVMSAWEVSMLRWKIQIWTCMLLQVTSM